MKLRTYLVIVAGVLLAGQLALGETYDLGAGAASFEPRKTHRSFDDFLTFSNSAGELGLSQTLNGSGALITNGVAGTDANRPGALLFQTGTTNTGRAGYGGVITTQFLGTALIWETAIRLEDLSDGTERYIVDVGVGDGHQAAGTGTDKVTFRYTDNENAGEWQGVCRTAGAQTAVDLNVAVVADTYNRLRLECNSTCTAVNFYIDGTLRGSCSANIPTAADALSLHSLKLEKTVGTTNRDMFVDYVFAEKTLVR